MEKCTPMLARAATLLFVVFVIDADPPGAPGLQTVGNKVRQPDEKCPPGQRWHETNRMCMPCELSGYCAGRKRSYQPG